MNSERFARRTAAIALAAAFCVGACSNGDGGDAGAGGANNGLAGALSGAGFNAAGAGQGGLSAMGGSAAASGGREASGGRTDTGDGGATGQLAGGGTSADAGAGASSADAGSGGAGAGSGGASAGSGGAGAGFGGAGFGGAGGASAAGGSSAGASSTYRPCPASGSPCKILPFGDSITRGAKSSDDAGYRSQLFKLIVAANQKATFIGSLTNGPTQVSGQAFPRTHEGHAGWTIDPGYNTSGNYGGISSLVPAPALSGNPNIILLQIGTNDLFFRDSANMPTRLEALLDKIAQNAPSALIVLAQITPLSTPNAALTAYNSKIPAIIQSHATKGQHIIGVDMSKLPVPDDLSPDGTHPNDRGYAYIAGVWYAAIKDLLPSS